jgi:hypothetical protein
MDGFDSTDRSRCPAAAGSSARFRSSTPVGTTRTAADGLRLWMLFAASHLAVHCPDSRHTFAITLRISKALTTAKSRFVPTKAHLALSVGGQR